MGVIVNNNNIELNSNSCVGKVDSNGTISKFMSRTAKFGELDEHITVSFEERNWNIMSADVGKPAFYPHITNQYIISDTNGDITYNIFTVSMRTKHIFVYDRHNDRLFGCMNGAQFADDSQNMCYVKDIRMPFILSKRNEDIYFIEYRYRIAISVDSTRIVYCGVYILRSAKTGDVLLGLTKLKAHTEYSLSGIPTREYYNPVGGYGIEKLEHIYNICQLNDLLGSEQITASDLHNIVFNSETYTKYKNGGGGHPEGGPIRIGFAQSAEKGAFCTQAPLDNMPELWLGFETTLGYEMNYSNSIFNPNFGSTDDKNSPFINLSGYNLVE